MKFLSKEAQNLTLLLPFWTVLSSKAAFPLHHSIHEILSKWLPTSLLTTTLGYGCSWAILFWAKHAPDSEIIALKIVKWIIAWKKYILMQVSSRFFSFLPISSQMEWHHINTTWLPSTVSKWRPPKSLLSRQISSG